MAFHNMKDYSRYKNSWKWNRGPHIETKLTQDEGRAILAQGGVFLRNAYDFDYNIETAYWYIIKDTFNGIQDVPSKYRGRLRKSLEKYEFKTVTPTFVLEEIYETYRVAAEHYRVKTTVPTKVEFEDIVKSLDDTYDIWVAIDKVSGRVAGFAINHVVDGMCDYDKMKLHPDFLKPVSPAYGLIYRMNEYYLAEKDLKYVSDGARSITEHSEIQLFLMKKFKFRKAYCHVQMFYKWWFKVIVSIAYPFRHFIKNTNVRAVLKMEEIARQQQTKYMATG